MEQLKLPVYSVQILDACACTPESSPTRSYGTRGSLGADVSVLVGSRKMRVETDGSLRGTCPSTLGSTRAVGDYSKGRRFRWSGREKRKKKQLQTRNVHNNAPNYVRFLNLGHTEKVRVQSR